jgi:hypothetical protein
MKLSFFERQVRTGTASETAIIAAILGAAAVTFVTAGHSAVSRSVVFLLVVALAGIPHHHRNLEKMRRGKEILNRYSPERNSKPLGL